MPKKVIAQFSVSQVEILAPDGTVDRDLEPSLGDEALLAIYRNMVLAREADSRMLKLQRQGRIGTFALCTGQEGASVGAAAAMGPSDWLVGSFRELGARLVRGEPLEQYLLNFAGFEEGNMQPAAEGGGPKNRVLPVSVIVGAQTLHAVGLAYAAKYRREQSAVVTFFGDGATSEGDFHEAMNFAAVWRVPVVFVCINNQWAISIPSEKQTASETIAQKAVAYGMPSVRVDGNDVLAVYSATKDALARANDGAGPTLVEAVTYRLLQHTTADDPRKYRTEAEEQQWWEREPLVRFRRYLENKGLWDPAREEALRTELRREIEAAVNRFESQQAAQQFAPDAPFSHVYGTQHPELERQRREFLARQESAPRRAEVHHG